MDESCDILYFRPMAAKLPLKFYRRPDTEQIARELLGCVLVHVVSGKRLSGRIVETEAYLGIEDRAAHTFGGRRTERVKSMWLDGGHAYVYFIYGMHFCINVVTRSSKEPEAVLLRALEPLEGIEQMRKHRQVKNDRDLANGPGKLCAALGIDRECDGTLLTRDELFIERAPKSRSSLETIIAGPRVGVDYAGAAATWPLRFRLLEESKARAKAGSKSSAKKTEKPGR